MNKKNEFISDYELWESDIIIRESDLIIPAIRIISRHDNGIDTSSLINLLEKEVKPSGIYLKKLKNRNDNKFTQLVRNLRSHRTLEKIGYATYDGGLFKITKSGILFINSKKKKKIKYKK